MAAAAETRIYRVVFFNQGQIWELYARGVGPGNIPGFVQIEDLVFGERSKVVVDPTEEKLKTELAGVRRLHVPMHAVVRIDEVEREGAGRITAPVEGASVAHFPAIYRPGKDPATS